MQTVEKYLQPGEISLKLCEQYGLCVSTDYIRSIRRETITKGETLFVCGEARASDVYTWLKANPSFRAWPMARRARKVLS